MEDKIRSMIDFYNIQRQQYHQIKKDVRPDVATFVDRDKKRISWTRALKRDLGNNKKLSFNEGQVLISAYRPFTKRWMYYWKTVERNDLSNATDFPSCQCGESGDLCHGSRCSFRVSALMVDAIPNLHFMDTGQCFPLKLYEKTTVAGSSDDMFPRSGAGRYK